MSGSIVFAFTKGTPKEALSSSGPLIPLMALAMMLSINTGVAHADGSFFFQDRVRPQRQRATLSDQERDSLLQNAYACNRPGKTPEEEKRCQAREAQARQMIYERTRANHQLAEPQLRELRQLYRQQAR